jgi:hypothetical protein
VCNDIFDKNRPDGLTIKSYGTNDKTIGLNCLFMKNFFARKFFCLLFLPVSYPGFALDNKGGHLVHDSENGGVLPKMAGVLPINVRG